MKTVAYRLLSILLTLLLILSSMVFTSAKDNKSIKARFFDTYGNYMLFQQKKNIIFSGKGNPGKRIDVRFYDKDKKIIRQGTATVNNAGIFKVTLSPMNGGFYEYTVIGYENGKKFATLKNVVIGELWLCGGQSNMQYNLKYTKEGQELLEKNQGDYYIRALMEPTYPKNDGFASKYIRVDAPGSKWMTGKSDDIGNITAVGYFFAKELKEKLKMPVGILAAYIGGSTIFTWLPYSTINANVKIKNYLIKKKMYISEDEIAKTANKDNARKTITYGYNQKIAPLKNFAIKGMIWYQGEANVGDDLSVYTEAFLTLQKAYSKLFGFESFSMPMICSQLASYHYAPEKLQYIPRFNEAMANAAAKNKNISVIPIYDITLTYNTDEDNLVGPIHPNVKKPVAQRMARAAENLVYNGKSPVTAATVKSIKATGNEVTIKFANVGSGLYARPYQTSVYKISPEDKNTLYGFSVSGESGVFVEAHAQLVDKETVKVWSEYVDTPKYVNYAFSEVSRNANLFSTDIYGKPLYPVTCFTLPDESGMVYMQDKSWTTCEITKAWHTFGYKNADYFDAWTYNHTYKTDVDLIYTSDDKYYGAAALQVDFSTKKTYGENVFSIVPKAVYNKKYYSDIDVDYTKLLTMSFYVKNNSERPLRIKMIRLYETPSMYYTPVLSETGEMYQTINKKSGWENVTADFTHVYLFGNEASVPLTSAALDRILQIEIIFDDFYGKDSDKGSVIVDDFNFATADSEKAVSITAGDKKRV